MRRCAVSVPANIVEGCGRPGLRDYERFLSISFASIRELSYYIDLSERLGYIDQTSSQRLRDLQGKTAAALAALIKSDKTR
jgi:four helix bundle protein